MNVDEGVKCRGTWEVEDEEGYKVVVICPLRQSCFRYRSRYSIMVNFFDVVPMSIKGECQYYLEWQ